MNAALAAEVLPVDTQGSSPAAPGVLMTFEQWANMDEDEPGEFVDGRIVEEEVPSVLHEITVSWLIGALRTWGTPRDCPVFGSELKLRVARGRGRKPDVSMFPQGTRFRDASFLRIPPMLIVEVISRGARDVRRDRFEKRQEYAQFGVQHYWLVDPDARIFEFRTLGSDGLWHEATEVASEGRIEIVGFDGLILELDQLWREVDQWMEVPSERQDDIAEDEG